jgi:hypothetical protein
MPAVNFALLIPPFPLHWTSIAHYLVLLGAILLLLFAGDKTSIVYIAVVAIEALLVGLGLYSNLVAVPRLFIFLGRVLLLGIPVVLAGMAPTENARTVAVLMAIVALPLVVVLLITCLLGPIGDPHVLSWCG